MKRASFIIDNQVDAMLDLTARIFELQSMLENRLGLIRSGISLNYGGNTEEHEEYTTIIKLLNKGKPDTSTQPIPKERSQL